jgi:recombination protein RecA
MDIRKAGAIKQGQDIIGSQTKVKVVKNKVAPPFKEVIFDIMYGEGISKEGEFVDIGSAIDVIEKSGSWYSMNGERIGQGRENAKAYFRDNPEAAAQVEEKILNHYGLSRNSEATAEA